MTSGTIEEKIYYKQVYKQLLTHKILNDPKQQFSDVKLIFKLLVCKYERFIFLSK